LLCGGAGLVGEGKYLWQAFQGGNNVGGNNNNNSQGQGGDAHDAAFCTEVRCGELIIRILRICPGVCL
jgi:hypothetical protein